MQTSDPDYLFQTSAQNSESKNRKKKQAAAAHLGSPIAVGKVIDFIIHESQAFVAEAGWRARRVDLQTGRSLQVYKGHKGPVTSLALYSGFLFTASWDKTIKIWDVEEGSCLQTLTGHSDFVKSLLIIPGFLLSTSSDRTIKLWRIDSDIRDRQIVCSQTVQHHSRPVVCSASNVQSYSSDEPAKVWTADSMGLVNEFDVTKDGLKHVRSFQDHETSVNRLLLTDDGLWSVATDKRVVFRSHEQSEPVQSFGQDAYLRSVCFIAASARLSAMILTGGDDENVHVWSSSDDWRHVELIATLQAHSDSVTAIRLWNPPKAARKVITGSLDGTLRQWTLDELLNPPALVWAEEDEKAGGMTAEEEMELEELMNED